MTERLGLTDEEVLWLQTHRENADARKLINQYQMVVACPRDPGARGIFSAMLDEWRRSNPDLSAAVGEHAATLVA
jgi:hypothetical protein